MTFTDATRTLPCIKLALLTDRRFWLAEDRKTGAVFGSFDGRWFA